MNREGIIDPGSLVARSSIAGYSCDTWHTLLTPTTTLNLQQAASIFLLPFCQLTKRCREEEGNPTLSSHNCVGTSFFNRSFASSVPRRHFSQTVMIMLWKRLPGRVENATGANEQRLLGVHGRSHMGEPSRGSGTRRKKWPCFLMFCTPWRFIDPGISSRLLLRG